MKEEELSKHFNFVLIDESNFDSYAKCSIDQEDEMWFRWIYNMKRVQQIKFDRICQRIMTFIFMCYEMTIDCGDTNVRASFWYNVNKFIHHDYFSSEILSLFPAHKRSRACAILLIYLLQDVFWVRLGKVLKYFVQTDQEALSALTKWDGSLNLDSENKEICGFFMYAIASLIKKKKNLMKRQDPKSIKASTLERQNQFLMEMRIFEMDVMNDRHYLTHCVSDSDKLINRGGMSYISQKYYHFAKELMRYIRVCTSRKMLMSRENNFIVWGKRDMDGNDELRVKFLEVENSVYLCESEKLFLYKEIWTKVFHAGAGVTTNSYKDENDVRHCKDGFGGESFRTTLKVKSLEKTTEKVEKIKEKINIENNSN